MEVRVRHRGAGLNTSRVRVSKRPFISVPPMKPRIPRRKQHAHRLRRVAMTSPRNEDIRPHKECKNPKPCLVRAGLRYGPPTDSNDVCMSRRLPNSRMRGPMHRYCRVPMSAQRSLNGIRRLY